MKRLAILIVALVAFSVQSEAQDGSEVTNPVRTTVDSSNTSSVTGVLTDTKGNPIVNAYVECTVDGKVVGRELTDFDGIYVIKPISERCVDVTFKFQGRQFVAAGIMMSPGNSQVANGTIRESQGCSFYTRCARRIPDNRQHPGASITHSGNMLW